MSTGFITHRDRRPLPQRLRGRILAMIRNERMRPGDQLPAEPELCERFQVGRSTVREAMKLLERDGLIEVRHGRGSFVSAVAELRSERPITRFESATDLMAGLGYHVENRVLGVRERRATDVESVELALPKNAVVVDLERLRLHDGQVFIYSQNVFAREVLTAPLHEIDWGGSLIELLAEFGHVIISSAAHIRAVATPERLSTLDLDIPAVPWLLITETCVSSKGQSILNAQDYHRSDVFAFHVVRRHSGD
jgi:GntR family transcriptional regulator